MSGITFCGQPIENMTRDELLQLIARLVADLERLNRRLMELHR